MQGKGENSILTDGWWDSDVFPKGWIIKMLLAGETLDIFLLTGISNLNICLIKKNINVVFLIATFMLCLLLKTLHATLKQITIQKYMLLKKILQTK